MENRKEIPKEIQERVQKTNQEVITMYELKNKYYQLLTGLLPVMDKIMVYFTNSDMLSEDILENLLKKVEEINAYLEGCVFQKEFLPKEKYEKLISQLQETANSQEWQSQMVEVLTQMRENIVLAKGKAEKQRHTCCCCNRQDFFLPLTKYYDFMQEYYGAIPWNYETQNSEDMVCPGCGSFDRERLMVLALQQEDLRQKKILQIAPSPAVDHFIKSRENAGYDTCDLFMEGVSYQADIQNMDMVEAESYHIWICSHVLEHVLDDRKAMQELYRITKKGGYGFVLVPLDLNQKETDEEWGRPVEECWRRFGQDDHTRKYAKHDFVKRLEDSGFEVEELNMDFFGKEIFEMNSLSKTSVLYKVKR